MTDQPTGPRCIVCNKPIKKIMRGLTFIPATGNGRQNGDRKDHYVYLDPELRPATVEEAQRYTNNAIIRHSMSGGKVFDITWWEGEYEDPHFHSQTCAAAFGRRMARKGYR